MRTRSINKICLLVLCIFASTSSFAKGVHWGYNGKAGPSNWGDLDKKFHLCKKGLKQSPIDIVNVKKEETKKLTFNYADTPLNIVNNGHTLQVNYKAGSTLLIGKNKFNLLQFHFHTPSEHKVKSKTFPIEAHFVHANDKKELAVIGVMIKEGKANKTFAAILENAPTKVGEKSVKSTMVNGKAIQPSNMNVYYNYSGSLTTPPCSEGVNWIVIKEPIEMSKAQIERFKKIFSMNARPVQKIGSRQIKTSQK